MTKSRKKFDAAFKAKIALAVGGKTGKFEVLPFRFGALCWWFSRLARHKRLFLVSLRSSPYAATNFGMRIRL
jgi:hypothetical protein